MDIPRNPDDSSDAVIAAMGRVSMSTEMLANTVRESIRYRRAMTVVVMAVVVMVGVWQWSTYSFTKNLNSVAKENHQLLVVATSVAGPQAQAEQAARTTRLIDAMIICINNHTDHQLNPSVAIDPSCPVAAGPAFP